MILPDERRRPRDPRAFLVDLSDLAPAIIARLSDEEVAEWTEAGVKNLMEA
jgi:hypothetical protein